MWPGLRNNTALHAHRVGPLTTAVSAYIRIPPPIILVIVVASKVIFEGRSAGTLRCLSTVTYIGSVSAILSEPTYGVGHPAIKWVVYRRAKSRVLVVSSSNLQRERARSGSGHFIRRPRIRRRAAASVKTDAFSIGAGERWSLKTDGQRHRWITKVPLIP